MDLLDSPLNLAHQQSRKADKYLKIGRYDDAIECHRKAAEYLTKAMAATTIQQALESLSLQRESHIRQQAIIREKQRRALLADRQTVTPDPSPSNVASKPSSGESSATARRSCGSEEGIEMTDQDSLGIYRTMEECDSLLQFLNNRTAEGYTGTSNAEYKARGHDKQCTPGGSGGIKTPKDDKTIIEELRLHNDALRGHILQFLKESEEHQRQMDYQQRELEYTRKENRDLKDRLSKVEHGKTQHAPLGADPLQQETFYSMPMALNLDKLPSLELPPLEMPKFDFDSLKPNHDEEGGAPSQ